MRNVSLVSLVMVGLVFVVGGPARSFGDVGEMPGLIGWRSGDPDFSDPEFLVIIKHINHDWTGGSQGWSAVYYGSIEGPYTGTVNFFAEADNGLKVEIDGATVMDGLGRGGQRQGTRSMTKGQKHTLKLSYVQDGDPSYLKLYWSWPGQEQIIIDELAFSYTQADWDYAMSHLSNDYWSWEEAPIHFDGTGSEALDLSYQDGRLTPAVGTENYQVHRCNRERSSEFTGGHNYTYSHGPNMCYWNGKYHVEFLSAPDSEHDPRTVTLWTSSVDGKNWETPQILFPYFTPEGDDHETITHQRMGFYVSNNNRLLILAFFGRWPTPCDGTGVGRAVREIYADGSYGPLYFIKYNRHMGFNEGNTPYPYYTESPDSGFVAICNELRANKLMVQQWFEEDCNNSDGFYMFGECDTDTDYQAFNWYTRADGIMIGIFKNGFIAHSPDGGQTWQGFKVLRSIIVGGAKMWGQQTEDGRYAVVYNPDCDWRYPLVGITSDADDGRVFSNMVSLHGELAPRRYVGREATKEPGPQYVRGITQGINGDPPGSDMWLTYSVGKEDIWVSRVQVPIRHKVDKWVDEDFDNTTTGGPVSDWNIYSPTWAPVDVAEFPSSANKSLKFSDKEPYDYARALRVFPQSQNVTVKFAVLAKQTSNGRMEVDIKSRKGTRPVQVMLSDNGKIQVVDGEQTIDVMNYQADKWYNFSVKADIATETFSVSIDGNMLVAVASFAQPATELQRVVFRTGEYRMKGIGKPEHAHDLPGAGNPVAEAVFYVDNVSARAVSADPNNDGIVNFIDFAFLVEDWLE